MAKYPKVSSEFKGRLKRSKIKSRLLMFGIITVVVFVILSFFWGEFGFFRMWILSKRIERLEKEIATLQVEKQDLLWEMDKMKNDSDYIKRYAVEKYGYARPDQKVIQFVPADTSRVEIPSESPDQLPDSR
jgi:cell division protein FtsB